MPKPSSFIRASGGNPWSSTTSASRSRSASAKSRSRGSRRGRRRYDPGSRRGGAAPASLAADDPRARLAGVAINPGTPVEAVAHGRDIAIEVDGGIDVKTAPEVVAAGATRLVAGNAVFRDGPAGYAKNIEAIRAAAMGVRGEMV